MSEQEKYSALFWVRGVISILKRDAEATRHSQNDNVIYDTNEPETTVESLYSKRRNKFSNYSSPTYHNVSLLLSGKPELHSLDQFDCPSFDKFKNKNWVTLYALKILSEEVSKFMLDELNYRAGLDLPDSPGEDSYLHHPSILVQIIIDTAELKESDILKDYLEALKQPDYIDFREVGVGLGLVQAKMNSLDEETHPKKWTVAFVILHLHSLLLQMVDEKAKKILKMVFYRSLIETRTASWNVIKEEADKFTPEQNILFEVIPAQPPKSTDGNEFKLGTPPMICKDGQYFLVENYQGGPFGEFGSPLSLDSASNEQNIEDENHDYETHHGHEQPHKKRSKSLIISVDGFLILLQGQPKTFTWRNVQFLWCSLFKRRSSN
ncbi:unnamed protein product [Ambrosiozyma monospora]|uniref:Unnamed protein product n=1 Tax=Ambrosiozyma monospora TaxID=43982 RepID=A0ACB5TJT0_AMBMO|nr:unnamed protein product [Ambrosiozyma monospora]